MIISKQSISAGEIRLLDQLVGEKWDCISGPGMVDPDFNWGKIVIHTVDQSVSINLVESPINISGEIDDYPHLAIEKSRDLPNSNEIKEKYFFGRGETIQNIWIVRDELRATRDSIPWFRNIADVGIVVQLDIIWVSICRTSHFMDAFEIRYVNSRAEVVLPDSLQEWDETLFDRFALDRRWIPTRSHEV